MSEIYDQLVEEIGNPQISARDCLVPTFFNIPGYDPYEFHTHAMEDNFS